MIPVKPLFAYYTTECVNGLLLYDLRKNDSWVESTCSLIYSLEDCMEVKCFINQVILAPRTAIPLVVSLGLGFQSVV